MGTLIHTTHVPWTFWEPCIGRGKDCIQLGHTIMAAKNLTMSIFKLETQESWYHNFIQIWKPENQENQYCSSYSGIQWLTWFQLTLGREICSIQVYQFICQSNSQANSQTHSEAVFNITHEINLRTLIQT